MTANLQDSALDTGLRAVWKRDRRRCLCAGLLALCLWAVPLFLVGMAVDWLAYLPAAGRSAILFVLVAVSFRQAWRHGWRNLRSFDPTRAALEVEDRLGRMESLLVTAVQFGRPGSGTDGSEALREVTRQNAEGAAGRLDPRKLVDFKALRRPACCAAALAGTLAFFAWVNGPFLAAGLTRIFTPWVEVAYPTKTKLDLGPEDLVVKEGDGAEIVVGVSGVVPAHADLYLRTGEGTAREMEVEIVDGRCRYLIASASRDFSYRVKAGDARSPWRRVRVVPPPKIENARVTLTFPSYLERPDETVDALTLSVPEDTNVRWKLTLDRPVRDAVLHRDGEEPERLEVADGRELLVEVTADASRGYSFSWVEKAHGFAFASPRYFLQVASDQPPRVELVSPAANLDALPGRPLSIVARAGDDHGIGSAAITYRVNLRDEQSDLLETPLRNGGGEQAIDWDYREVLPDLKIGDTLSFLIEVKDKYPDGPHLVRSETRRLTFLSKEDYLERIRKKRDRLLSRVQAAYRKQRAAFESVRGLEPNAYDYAQACQVEAIRQELVRDRLKGIAGQLKDLLDDLAANGVSDAPEGETLEQVRSTLLALADTHLAEAASRLRRQSGLAADAGEEAPDPASAARAVNAGARGLGALVLLRGIDSAGEVYARETRMLAQVQASLRWRTVQAQSTESEASLAKEQAEPAEWTHRLLEDLQAGMRYEKRPLAVLRLVQSIKGLKAAEAQERMRRAAALVTQGEIAQAESLQGELVTTLLDAEFSVRLSGAYSTLIKTLERMRAITKDQAALRQRCAESSAQAFEAGTAEAARAQEQLRKRLLTLLLQTVPAPRPKLLDETWPGVPPVRQLLKDADRAMAEALAAFAGGEREAVLSGQLEAEQTLAELTGLVEQWSVELGLQTLGLSTLVAVTGERIAFIEEFEAKVVALLEKTDVAAADGRAVTGLYEEQLLLAEELTAFNEDLVKQGRDGADRDAPPLLSRMKRAERALREAVAALEANDADRAIGRQEQAADVLSESFEVATTQNERLDLLQSLLMFQRSIGFAIGYLADVVAEQEDLLAATEALESDDVSHLLPPLNNLRKCIGEVAPLLDMVAARIDTGTPLAFAVADLEDAAASLQGGDALDALDAQEVAAESLEEVGALVKAVRAQAGYVAEVVEFLHLSGAEVAMLDYRQDELARETEAATPEQLKALTAKQDALRAKAEEEGRSLVLVTGMPAFAEPAKLMSGALERLDANDAPAAAEQMTLAREQLLENAESLFAVITMLHGLPLIEIMADTEPELKRLVDALAVATAHKALFRDTNRDVPEAAETLAKRQGALAARCREIAEAGEPHAMLEAASAQLAEATAALEASDLDETRRHQQTAMHTLRRFVIEQALILETAAPPPAAQDDAPDADGVDSDSESEFSAGFIADFVSGEAPKDQRSGWKVRGDRNRAALNQNFARELPLEYRGLLKNYYERVAE